MARSAEAPPSVAACPSRVSLIHLLAVSFPCIGIAIMENTSNFLMPDTIERFTTDPRIIGLILALNPFFGFVAQPWAGYYSDKLWTPMGRRKPVFLVSVILLALSCFLLPFSPTFLIMVAAVTVYQFTVDVNSTLMRSLIADTVPSHQRGRGFGFVEFFGKITGLLVLIYGGAIAIRGEWLWYYTAGVIALLSVLPMFIFVKEPYTPCASRERFSIVRYFREIYEMPRFLHLCLIIAANFVAVNAITNYYRLFSKHQLNMTIDTSTRSFFMFPLTVLIAAPIIGWLSDKIQKRRFIQFGITMVAGAAITGLFTTAIWQINLLAFLAGLGYTCTEVPMNAYLVSFMPRNKIGQLTGAANVFRAVPRTLMLSSVGFLVKWNGNNYRVAFYVSVAACVVSFILIALLPKKDEISN